MRVGRLLITLSLIATTIGPIVADWNDTHVSPCPAIRLIGAARTQTLPPWASTVPLLRGVAGCDMLEHCQRRAIAGPGARPVHG